MRKHKLSEDYVKVSNTDGSVAMTTAYQHNSNVVKGRQPLQVTTYYTHIPSEGIILSLKHWFDGGLHIFLVFPIRTLIPKLFGTEMKCCFLG